MCMARYTIVYCCFQVNIPCQFRLWFRCRYLYADKSQDSVDGVLAEGEKHPPSYNPVFQFPQEPQQFPTHPSLPWKPDRIELRHPQMKFAPGGGGGEEVGHIVLPESPFPAPYLYDRGPGLQTPFIANRPIQKQPRALNGSSANGKQLVSSMATTKRKKRLSRSQAKHVSLEVLDYIPTATGDEKREGSEERDMEKRRAQGRQMSLPSSQPLSRGRKRIFSLSAKRVPVRNKREKENTTHRYIHRSRTVGSSPSRQPSVDPDKLRRCQTPDFSLGDEERSAEMSERKKGLALRKCKTPDMIVSGSSREATIKRESDSPETIESLNLTTTSSPGSLRSDGAREGEAELGGGGGEEGGRGGKKDLLAATDVRRRKWGSRRSGKDSSQAEGGSRRRKTSKVHAQVTSSTVSYLASGSVAAAGANGGSSAEKTDPPLLYFSLYFDIQRRALTVNLIKVVNLPQKPPNQGSCDPFVMMFLLPNKQEVLQSVIKQRTLNPEFQQVFEFGGILANDLKNQVLVFRVFDHDRSVCVCVCVYAIVGVAVLE